MKQVFTIPPHLSFLDTLAAGLWAWADGDGMRLAAMRVYLPTRRACRGLREALAQRAEDRALLLPRMQPIGDVDEEELLFADAAIESDIPPAITPLRRRLLLARLIAAKDPSMSVDQAAHLAEALARFLDEAQIHRCDFTQLPMLVQQQELAEHWQETVRFLSILTEEWPKLLQAEGCLDPAERQNRIMAAQIAAWQHNPPTTPIIAAGSTGTIPATADFLAAIAALPSGAFILPGLDTLMDEEAWQAVDEFHPQHGMKHVLEVMGVERGDVNLLPSDNVGLMSSPPLAGGIQGGLVDRRACVDQPPPPPPASGVGVLGATLEPTPYRTTLLREAMRPAATSEAWRYLNANTLSHEAVSNLSRTDCAHPQEEAQVIALMLRQALEIPNQTVALVTPDRGLAERVVVLLGRWGIAANDSAGCALAETPIGGFLSDVLAATLPVAGAVAFLSLLKHPFTACGLAPAECRAKARQIEITHWRNDRPEAAPWLDELKTLMQPMTGTWQQTRPLTAWIDDHIRIAEQIAASATETGSMRLWQSAEGEAAVAWLNDLRHAADGFTPITGETYVALFTALLRQARYRPAYGQHPRLTILGPLEARLLHPDVVILGGMNETIWPPEAAIDPWMSRPMKKAFGMALPDYRIGLAAHDFVQLAHAPRVMMTRSRRSGGSPTVPSRFLLQIDTVLRALGYSDATQDALTAADPWVDWARMLDEPAPDAIKPCDAPEPCPPLALRPTTLSVTDIATWQRNPYAIYARHVLDLRKLDDLEAAIDAADRGNLIHQALEQFIRAFPKTLPPDALDKLLAIGRTLYTAYDDNPEVQAFWWPRFEKIAAWFIAHETERRASGIMPEKVEISGAMLVDSGFTLKGRADRIDRMPDGTLAIVDYKTGGVPSKKEVGVGLEPQLPLLALIAEHGGFKDLGAARASRFGYWHLLGGKRDDKDVTFDKNTDALIVAADDGLRALITAFADPATAYHAVPKPGFAPRFNDYAHLARLAEWGRTAED